MKTLRKFGRERKRARNVEVRRHYGSGVCSPGTDEPSRRRAVLLRQGWDTRITAVRGTVHSNHGRDQPSARPWFKSTQISCMWLVCDKGSHKRKKLPEILVGHSALSKTVPPPKPLISVSAASVLGRA